MENITLYEFESPLIKISMRLYFNKENQLIFDGYDIGKRVGELMGDSDYEYYYTIDHNEVQKIANHFNIDVNDKKEILQELKRHFSGNDAYSKFGGFMKENNIHFKPFIW